jgi:hypothetical protein
LTVLHGIARVVVSNSGAARSAGCLPAVLQRSSRRASGGDGDSATATSSSGSGNSSGSGSSTGSGSTASCIANAEETQGPYPADGSNTVNGITTNVLTESGVVRSDIRSSFGSSTTTAGTLLIGMPA